jgi:acetyl esterase/lipase
MQNVGPILILCSEDDQLAPYSVVENFANRLLELGGDVNLVKWHSSPHVGMFFSSFLSTVYLILY